MAFGRRRRSLVQTAAHTAVIAGTANAVNSRSSRRQAAQQTANPAVADPAVQAVPTSELPSDDVISKIERLAALHASGALTDEEFGALKAKALSL